MTNKMTDQQFSLERRQADHSGDTISELSRIRNTQKLRYKSVSGVSAPITSLVQVRKKFTFENKLLRIVSVANKDLPVEAKALLELMTNSGLRVSEALNIKGSKVFWDGSILVKGLKGSEDRIVKSVNYYSFWLYLRKYDLNISSYYTRSYLYKLLLREGIYICHPKTQKKSVSHALRYFYISRLMDNGLTLAEIKTAIGHKTEKSTIHYTNKILDYGRQ